MAKNLTYYQAAKNMTAREQAKLVVSLMLNGVKPIKESGEEPTKEYEVREVISAIPPENSREYNFYIYFRRYIWDTVMPIIEVHLQYLDQLEGRITGVRQALSNAPLVSEVLRQVKRLPVLVTPEEYQEALKRAIAYKRADIIPIDDLAQEEAYYGLEDNGTFAKWYGEDSKGDYEGWVEFMQRHGKTETNIALPSDEIYEEWVRTVNEAKGRILQAVKEGKLKRVKRIVRKRDLREKSTLIWEEIEKEGIEFGSYYDWKDRWQKFKGEEGTKNDYYNPLHEEFIHITHEKGKLTFYEDPDNTNDDFTEWAEVGIPVKGHEIEPEALWKNREHIVKYLETLLPVEVGKRDFDKEEQIIRLTTPQLEGALKGFIEKANSTIVEILNYNEVIRIIEDRYFDGMEIVSRDPSNPTGTITRALQAIHDLIQTHNGHLRTVVDTFSHIGFDIDVKFENIHDLRLPTKHNPNLKAVNDMVAEMEAGARKDSGYGR